MDIRQLKCFDAVLSTGAMTRAADLLGLAQPTVSITIAQLEREIGFPLFKRSRGSLQPTPEAFSLHQAAMQAIDSISRVGQVAREIRRLNEGEVSLLCYPGIAWRTMPELIAEFRRGRPGIQIKMVSRSSAALRQLATSQNFDTAIVEAPVRLPAADIEVFKYRCVCVLAEDHSLGNRKRVTPKDLNGVPIAILFPDHTTNHQIRKAFSEHGAELNVALECDFFISACTFVSSGGGAAIVDPITASQLSSDRSRLVPFEPAIEYELALVRSANRTSSRLSEKFHETVRERLHELQ